MKISFEGKGGLNEIQKQGDEASSYGSNPSVPATLQVLKAGVFLMPGAQYG